jgi:hypothetical protein
MEELFQNKLRLLRQKSICSKSQRSLQLKVAKDVETIRGMMPKMASCLYSCMCEAAHMCEREYAVYTPSHSTPRRNAAIHHAQKCLLQ